MTIESQVADLEAERALLISRRSVRMRDSNAYKRMTKRLKNLDDKLGYLKKIIKRHQAEEQARRTQALINGRLSDLPSEQE